MNMPQPTEAHRRMAAFTGSWIGDEVIHPMPWDPLGAKTVGRMNARMALGGFHLIMDWSQERDGKVSFEGHGVMGWDPRGKCYTLHWFDCMGFEHAAPHLGTWEDGVLTLVHETNHAGFSRQRYQVGDAEYRFQLDSSTARPTAAPGSPFSRECIGGWGAESRPYTWRFRAR